MNRDNFSRSMLLRGNSHGLKYIGHRRREQSHSWIWISCLDLLYSV